MGIKIGFIGAGKMASAIMGGIIKPDFIDKNNIKASEINKDCAKIVSESLGIEVLSDNNLLVKNSDVVVLAVKPFIAKVVLEGIKDNFDKNKVIISICAGISTSVIADILGNQARVIRVMPNTPALVNEGATGVCKGKYAKEQDLELALNIFSKCGKSIEISEDKIDAVTGVSGSGPAYYYYIIDKMAKAGVNEGLDYKTALMLSAQTALGAAKMILDCNLDIETLIKNVTTPGGTTEVGNKILEKSNFQKLMDEVVSKTAQKSKDLGGQ